MVKRGCIKTTQSSHFERSRKIYCFEVQHISILRLRSGPQCDNNLNLEVLIQPQSPVGMALFY